MTKKMCESKNFYCYNIPPTGPIFSKADYYGKVRTRILRMMESKKTVFVKSNNALWERRRKERLQKLNDKNKK